MTFAHLTISALMWASNSVALLPTGQTSDPLLGPLDVDLAPRLAALRASGERLALGARFFSAVSMNGRRT